MQKPAPARNSCKLLCVKTLGTFFVQNSRHSRPILVHSRSFPFYSRPFPFYSRSFPFYSRSFPSYSRSFPFIPVLFSSIPVHSRSILGASPVLLVPFSACVRDAVGVRAGGGAAGGGREGPGRNPRSRIDPNARGADLGAWEGSGWGRGEPWGRRARGWAGISWRASASACVNGRRA